MEKILITGLFIFLFAIHSSGVKRIYGKQANKDCGNCTVNAYECIRGSPPDTTESAIKIESSLNSININGEILKTNSDTLGNKIYLNGAGNKISIEQKEHTSKIIISQKGKGNRISIIQK